MIILHEKHLLFSNRWINIQTKPNYLTFGDNGHWWPLVDKVKTRLKKEPLSIRKHRFWKSNNIHVFDIFLTFTFYFFLNWIWILIKYAVRGSGITDSRVCMFNCTTVTGIILNCLIKKRNKNIWEYIYILRTEIHTNKDVYPQNKTDLCPPFARGFIYM